MKMTKSITLFKPTSAFSKILYQLILLVCIGLGLFGFIASEICTRGMMDEAKKNNYLVLKQNQSSIDDDLLTIRSVLILAGQNRAAKKLISLNAEEFNEYNSTTVQDVVMYLNSFKSTNDQINNIWIYQRNADTIVSSEGKMSVGTFFSSNCVLEKEVDWDDVYKTGSVNYLGTNTVKKGYSETPVYMYCLSLPLALGYSKGHIVVNVNDRIFSDRFETNENPASVFVLDENNNVIYMNSAAKNEAGKDGETFDYIVDYSSRNTSDNLDASETVKIGKGREYALMGISSALNGWKYYSLIPTDYIYKKAENIKTVCYMMIIISIIVSVIIAFRIIIKLNKPITEILSFVRQVKPKDLEDKHRNADSEFELINDLISYVYDENEKLKKNVEQTKPFVREKYLDKLLNDRVDEIRSREYAEELEFTRENYQVIVVESESTSRENRHQSVRDEIAEKLGEAAADINNAKIHLIHKGEHDDVYVINASEEFYASAGVIDFLSGVRKILDTWGMQYTIGVGRNYKTPNEIYLSYIEALQAVKYQEVIGQNTIIFIDEVKDIQDKFVDYSIKRENQLISAAKTGNYELTKGILDEIMDDNFKGMVLVPTDFAETLFGSLFTTAYRIANELSLSEEEMRVHFETTKDILINGSIEEKKSYIYSLYEGFCEKVNTRRTSKHDNVLKKTIQYVNDHYKEGISLEIVASEVNLSPAYLGYIFKEEMGTNFVDFVNNFRIERAKQMLKETNLTATEIAEETGFYSYNRFTKVFKKYIGLTPKQYRSGENE